MPFTKANKDRLRDPDITQQESSPFADARGDHPEDPSNAQKPSTQTPFVANAREEQKRLEALRRYDILDTFPENSFERLTRLMANIFGTPIALISLLDEERQWFKSHHGLDATETPMDVSFCKHAVQQQGVFTVLDASKDPRFANNGLVTGEPGIRFYAGAPLRTPEGTQIGTLCVIDRVPRRALRESEKQILADVAAVVVDEMELRLALRRSAWSEFPSAPLPAAQEVQRRERRQRRG